MLAVKFMNVRQAQVIAEYFAQKYPALASKCGERVERAVKVLAFSAKKNDEQNPDVILVQSENKPNTYYEVDLTRRSCSCPDASRAAAQGAMCKHLLAVGMMSKYDAWISEINPMACVDRQMTQQFEETYQSIVKTHKAAMKMIADGQAIDACCEVTYRQGRGTDYRVWIARIFKAADNGHIMASIIKADNQPFPSNRLILDVDLVELSYPVIWADGKKIQA